MSRSLAAFGLGHGMILGGEGSAFSPDSLPGLQLWLDATDASTLKQNSGGTGAVSADGDPVGYWLDKSANARQLIQATSSRRGTYRVSGVDGGPCVEFDGVDDVLSFSAAWGLSGACTVGIRWQSLSTPGGSDFDGLLELDDGTYGTQILLCNFAGYQPYTLVNKITGVAAAAVGISDALDTSAHDLVWTHTGGSPSTTGLYAIWLDGVSKTVTASSLVAKSASQDTAIPAYRSVPIFPGNGQIRRMVVYSDAKSAGEIAQIGAWLRGT